MAEMGRGSLGRSADMTQNLDSAALERNLLLVCAGFAPGRVPLATVLRRSAHEPTVDGCWLSFESPTNDGGPSWKFRILTRDEEAARVLADALRKEEIYSVYPDGDRVRTILIGREDWGAEPKWIGGDISAAGVDSRQYTIGGNQAYGRK